LPLVVSAGAPFLPFVQGRGSTFPRQSSTSYARPTLISNGAGRRFFFGIRSCECVGLRKEDGSRGSRGQERVKKLIFEANPAMPLRQDCEIFRDFFSCIHLRSN